MTLKDFQNKWTGVNEGGFTVNRCFAFNDGGRRVFVAAAYDKNGGGFPWECIYAEYDNGEPFEPVCTGGETKSDLIDMMCGC